MLTTFRELMRCISPRLRRQFAWIELHAVVSAATDALAFALLYPLLQLLTATSKGGNSSTITIFQSILRSKRPETLEVRLGGLIVLTFIVSTVIGLWLTKRQCRLTAAVEADVGCHLFSDYMLSPYLEHVVRNSSQLIRNTHSLPVDCAASGTLSFLTLTQNLFTIVFLVAVIGILNPLVVLISVAYFGISVLVYTRYMTPRAKIAGVGVLESSRATLQKAVEGFGGMKAFVTSNASAAVIEDYRKHRAVLAKHRYRVTLFQQLPQYYLQGIMIGGIILFSVSVVVLHTSNVTALIGLVTAAFVRLLPSLYTSLSGIGKLKGVAPSIHEVFTELNRMKRYEGIDAAPGEHQSISGTASVSDASKPKPYLWRSELTFANVCFSYPGSKAVALDSISLSIRKGSFVGVVGPSGAGKTTMVDLILGLFPPDSGTLLLDNRILEGRALFEWRASVGYVPQDVFLIDGSVRENVAFGLDRKVVRDDDVWGALQNANLLDFVRGLPDQLDARLGERGVRISGGQRQRVGIARALFRQPAILVLDEATSALDTTAEAAVASTVEMLDEGLTRIVVAHRLSTVRNCDSIILLDHGRLVGMGEFAELREESALFKELAQHARLT